MKTRGNSNLLEGFEWMGRKTKTRVYGKRVTITATNTGSCEEPLLPVSERTVYKRRDIRLAENLRGAGN